MRWIPTKFASWPAAAAFSPACASATAGWPKPGRFAVRVVWSAVGLMVAGTASAGELATISAGPATGHWPWIALSAIAGLLVVVSFISRRRMHAVVGS